MSIDLDRALELAREALTAEHTAFGYPVGWIASDTKTLATALLALASRMPTTEEREALAKFSHDCCHCDYAIGDSP